MISPNDSAWDPGKRQIICKLCGARKEIRMFRLTRLSDMVEMFKKFEEEHTCPKPK